MSQEVLSLLEEALAILDDAQNESEGELKNEVSELWNSLDKLVEKQKQLRVIVN